MSARPEQSVDWIAVDWGTTHLRAWGLSGSDTVVWSGRSADGMAGLTREEFEDALLRLIVPVLTDQPVTVVACGMVGSRQGWVEAPYAAVPSKPLDAPMVRAKTRDPRLTVHVVAGLKQTNPAADVMRGEETQIAGFLALNPKFDGVLCLPGTHSKWAHISAEEVVSFQTFMTGEIFAALTDQSVLRHSTTGDGWCDEAFARGLDETLSRPEKLAASLFSIRAEGLLQGGDPAAARARLSGLLIGAELAAAKPYWLGQEVAILGADALARAYGKALEIQGLPATIADADRMTLAGLSAAHGALHANLKEHAS